MSRRTLKAMSLVLALVLLVPAGAFASTPVSIPSTGVWSWNDPGNPAGDIFSENSFRLKALGKAFTGLIEDEYTDLFLNPANVTKIDGNRLYTNLSNIQEKDPYYSLQNSLFGGGSFYGDGMTTNTHTAAKGANGLGFVTNIAGNSIGVLFGQRALSQVWTSSGSRDDKTDPTNNYNYSWEYETTAKDSTTKAMVLFGRKLSDTLSIGANVAMGATSEDTMTPNGRISLTPWGGSFDYSHYTGSTVRKSDSKEIDNVVGDASTVDKTKQLAIKAQAGANLAVGDFGVSISGSVRPVSVDEASTTENNTTDKYWTGTEYVTTKNNYNDKTTGKGNGTGIGFNGRVGLPGALVRDFARVYVFGDFDTVNVPLTGESTGTSITDNPADPFTVYSETTNTAAYSGKLDKTAFNVGLGAEKELFESTKLLLGVKFTNQHETAERTFGAVKTTTTTKDAGTGTVTTSTSTDDRTITKTTKQAVSKLSVPVGIETKVLPKLTLRLGADAVLYNSNNAEVTTVDDDKSTGLKTSDTKQLDPVNGTSAATESTYTVGARYDLNEKVYFDLLNVGTIVAPGMWTIGATIKF